MWKPDDLEILLLSICPGAALACVPGDVGENAHKQHHLKWQKLETAQKPKDIHMGRWVVACAYNEVL